ncbi:MAG TPA: heme-copper oxidase subunit III [Polyangia bacterium]|jgi:heme/copper-type cytochrome/quinol oxidase subunit 3|nr:heme-copper oxidase subunit III [Polyangia bacterium]
MTTGAAVAPAAHGASRLGVAGMWTFLAIDAMGFGGFFIAYGVLRVRADAWPDPRAHLGLGLAAAMTFALLASAFTMTQAARAVERRTRVVWLAVTIGLGLAFLWGEIAEYRRLWTAADPVRLGGDLYAATFYALTGYHGLHVAAGVICLIAVALSGARQRSLEVVALYWQFVDLAWMPIFTFLYLMPAR